MDQKIDPKLHECVSCSEKPGSPTLCARCYRARSKAGGKWHGRTPNRGEACPRCPALTTPEEHVTAIERIPSSPTSTARRANCHCGWLGPERGTIELAADDALQHEKSDHHVARRH